MYDPVGDYKVATSSTFHTATTDGRETFNASSDLQWLAIGVLFAVISIFAVLHYRQWRKDVLKRQRKLLKR